MQFDFDSVKDRVIENLRKKASWAEILFFSTNSRLVDAFAEEIANIASYDEFLTRNTRWDLATEKSALVTQAQFMQYDPHRKIGATGTIRVSSNENFNDTYSKIIEIPKYTVFSNGDEIKFTSTQIENLLTTDNYIDVPVVQGEPKTYTYIAQGQDYEEIEILNSNIEDTIYEITVNGELWTEVEDLNSSDSSDKVYELENKVNYNGINIVFGNGIFGKKLTEGDVITFKYVETLGIEGNVLSENVITTVESTIYDADDDQVEMYCKNTANLDGGTDEEDIEDIRTNGINAFQAGDKAVVQKDYEYKLEQNDYILKATVWGAYEYNLDNNLDLWTWIPTQENVVNVSAFTPGGEQLSTAQQNEVIAFIKEDKPPTDIVRFTDVNFIYLAFHIDAYVQDTSYVLSVVKNNIIEGVQEEFSLENIDFMEPIYETDWKGYINDIDGITYHSSYIEIIKFETFNEAYVGDLNLDLYPIEKESIKLYIKDTSNPNAEYDLMGVDDGDGNFIAESPYDLTGSSINYQTGEGVVQVNSGISGTYSDYSIKVYYQPDSINLCPNERNQIFKIYEITDVSAEYLEEGQCQ
jgi:hypothetical protein